MTMNNHSGKCLTTGRVATLLGVCPRTVSVWFDSGKVGGYRLPGRGPGPGDRRIPREGLVAFLRSNGMPVPAELLPKTRRRSVLLVGAEGFLENLARDLERELDGAVWVLVAADAFAAGVLAERLDPVDAALLDARGLGADGLRGLARALRGLNESVWLCGVSNEDGPCRPEGFVAWLQRPFSRTAAEAALRVLTNGAKE
jgi:two-component system response regulator RpaA